MTDSRGLFFAPPPQNSETTGWIYKIQTAFDRSRNFVEGNLMLLTSGSLMTSQVRSNSKCLTILRVWLCRALEPYGMEISQYNDMDRVWDTSKYHPKLSVSIFKVKVIQSHEVKERSNWKFWFGQHYTCFWVSFSWRTRKMTLKDFLSRPNVKNFENRENAEIAGNSVNNGRFRPSKHQNSVIFKMSTWNFVHIYTWQGSFAYIPFF